MIEPSQVKRCDIERSVLSELRFTGVVEVLTAVDPWSHDQSLEAFLGPSQLDVIQVGDLSAPGIVPTRGVVLRNVLVLGQMVNYAGARILPESVVIAMAHRFNQPGFVIGSKLERSGARPQGKASHIFADLRTHVHERFRGGWIGSGAVGRHERVWSSAGVAQSENPIEKAQLEGTVMADTITTEVRHRIAGHHRLHIRSIADGKGMLRRPGIGRPHRTDATVAPRLRPNPFGGIKSIIRIVDERMPAPLRLVAATYVLEDNHVSVWHEGVRNRRSVFLVVRRAHQNHGKLIVNGLTVFCGEVDVSRKLYSVSHRYHNVLPLSDTVARIDLSEERSANGQHNQQAQKGRKTGDELVFELPHHWESP